MRCVEQQSHSRITHANERTTSLEIPSTRVSVARPPGDHMQFFTRINLCVRSGDGLQHSYYVSQSATQCDYFDRIQSQLNFEHVKKSLATGPDRLRPCYDCDTTPCECSCNTPKKVLQAVINCS